MVVFLFLSGFMCSCSEAFTFYVGGKQGWVTKPDQDYNTWASNNRFQAHDSIVFKYKKGSDSVLLVNKEDYYGCHTNNSIKKWDDGETDFKFGRSGPFYFIGGSKDACQNGQKLIVVVLQPRDHKIPPPSMAPKPSPLAPPHISHPPTASQAPAATSPTTPGSQAPVGSPHAHSPKGHHHPGQSPSPSSPAPTSPGLPPPGAPVPAPSPAHPGNPPGADEISPAAPPNGNKPKSSGQSVAPLFSLMVMPITLVVSFVTLSLF
jgi:hypothetical protein